MGRLDSTLLLLYGLAALIAPPAPAAGPPRTHRVAIKGFKFEPERLEVNGGDTVIWTNEDIVPHTATSTKHFDSKRLDKGKSWSYMAKKTGSFPYICTYHPTMKGELVVK